MLLGVSMRKCPLSWDDRSVSSRWNSATRHTARTPRRAAHCALLLPGGLSCLPSSESAVTAPRVVRASRTESPPGLHSFSVRLAHTLPPLVRCSRAAMWLKWSEPAVTPQSVMGSASERVYSGRTSTPSCANQKRRINHHGGDSPWAFPLSAKALSTSPSSIRIVAACRLRSRMRPRSQGGIRHFEQRC